jgi:hypothetical protein
MSMSIMKAVSMAPPASDDDDGGNNRNSNNNSNRNNNQDDADAKTLIQERLLVLLSKQYNHLQDYCNAQIALENAYAWQFSQQSKGQQQSSSDLLQTVAALQKATQRVQDDFQSLETMVSSLSSLSSSLSSSSLSSSSLSTSTIIKELPQPVPSSSAFNHIITNDNDTTNRTRNRQRRHAHTAQWQVVQAEVEEHLQRTRNILHNLQTTTGQTSPLGIFLPTSAATKQEDTIVALATLRASVVQLQSVLQ